jgi:hypothetical protein
MIPDYSKSLLTIDEIMNGKEYGTVKILSANSEKGHLFVPLLRAELGDGKPYFLGYYHFKSRFYCRWRRADTPNYKFAGNCEKLPSEHDAMQQANAIQFLINEGSITRAVNDSKMNVYGNSIKNFIS